MHMSGNDNQNLFSCLCVTEDRAAFMPWLLWNFDRQTWLRRELVIVDSSSLPFESDLPDVRVITVPPGTGVAAKRNLALKEARGDLISWFDDDDWQHPRKLALLGAALSDGQVVYAGSNRAWLMELATSRCKLYQGSGRQPIFNSAGFCRSFVDSLRFSEELVKASDTPWIRTLGQRFPGRAVLLQREDLFFWLCHTVNLSNPAARHLFPKDATALRKAVGDAWGETDSSLKALVERLEALSIVEQCRGQGGQPRPGAVHHVSAIQSNMPQVTRAKEILDSQRLAWGASWHPERQTASALDRRLHELRPQRILELGSGSTTPLIAAFAAKIGSQAVTLEHESRFHHETFSLLRGLGLEKAVDLRLSKITEYSDGVQPHRCYALTDGGPFDFVFVDGPPKSIGREGVLFAIAPHLAEDAEIWLHDGLRTHERDCLDLWRQHFKFSAELVRDGKGVYVLRQVRTKVISADEPTASLLAGPDGVDDVASIDHAARKSVSEPECRHAPNLAVGTLHHPQLSGGEVGRAEGHPPISVMIKATIMDAPYLDVMARHMIAQARYPFTERVIIVDRKPVFSGKYGGRPRLAMTDLDRILRGLLEEDVIDRVLDVDYRSHQIGKVMRRYFGSYGDRVPTHASTGGPIYPTLFGLEMLSTDYVLQMDADVFFHAPSESWIEESLERMRRDPDLWLMMTHPGPPGGLVGASLRGMNARLAKWDSSQLLWRFPTATTRYFLCDRRDLHGRLVPVFTGDGCAPLEQCISRTLQIHGACRGALGGLQSWHLHAWYHGEPFPRWVAALARLVESGEFPVIQHGRYDLRLDRPDDRLQWESLLGDPVAHRQPIVRSCEGAQAVGGEVKTKLVTPCQRNTGRAAGTRARKAVVNEDGIWKESVPASANSGNGGRAPIAVVIPVRNRAGDHLRNALLSLNWQSPGPPEQIIIVSHGSRPEIDEEIRRICLEEHAKFLAVGRIDDQWNKPQALNIGIRKTAPGTEFLMTMDADMILAPNFLETVIRRLRERECGLILCRSLDLPREIRLPTGRCALFDSFETLCAEAKLRGPHGTGGIQAARRTFFFDVRGYDEDLVWWGAMDGDMVKRARLADLAVDWVEHETSMLHQWHPSKHASLSSPVEIHRAKRAWLSNHELVKSRSQKLLRNPGRWGGVTDGFISSHSSSE